MSNRCDECRFALFQDTGYSNYTVEGSDFYCLKGKHPDDGFDRFYNEDERLKFAETCEDFVPGDPTQIDCDRENQSGDGPLSVGYGADAEIKTLIDKWEARNP